MIRGRDIYIRVIQVDDAADVLKWENNKANWQFSENEGDYILLDILHLIDTMKDIRKAGQVRYIICEESTDRRIGTVDLFLINFESKTAEIGVLVAEKSDRKKGIAKESVILIESAAKELGVHEIHATVQDGNIPSEQLFLKAGYAFKRKINNKKSLYSKWLSE